MNHDSLILIHPTSKPAEDGHTIALINPWKFQSDWAKHLCANLLRVTGNLPSPHTPLYTVSRLRRLDKRNPEMEETAMQPEPAQTAKSAISGQRSKPL